MPFTIDYDLFKSFGKKNCSFTNINSLTRNRFSWSDYRNIFLYNEISCLHENILISPL